MMYNKAGNLVCSHGKTISEMCKPCAVESLNHRIKSLSKDLDKAIENRDRMMREIEEEKYHG